MLVRKQYLVGLAALAATLATAAPAPAVVLQQKWVAGQQLGYDVDFDGTVNLVVPPDAPFLFAGVPLEVKLKANSATVLDTISVDDFGTGTIAPRVEQMNVKAAALGQRGEIVMKDGKAAFSINGHPYDDVPRERIAELANPKFALLISRRGHVEGMVPIKAAPDGKSVRTKEKATVPGPGGVPLDLEMIVQTFISRALPSVWPERDVQAGDTWTGEVRWTAPPVAGSTAAPAPEIGKFNFTLRGEETIDGKKLYRVALDGIVEVDAARAAELSEKAPRKEGAAPKGSLTGARQKVVGDMWIDAEAGQVVRVAVNLQTQAKGKLGAGKPAPKGTPGAKTAPPDESQLDFAGNLKMQLKRVVMVAAASPVVNP